MKKHLLSALIATVAAGGLMACSHDKTKEADNMSSAAPTASVDANASATTTQPEVAAMETNTSTSATMDTSSQQQTQNYESSQRK